MGEANDSREMPGALVRFVGWVRRSWWVRVYLALLLVSHLVIALSPGPVTGGSEGVSVVGAKAFDVEIVQQGKSGELAGEVATIAGLRWVPEGLSDVGIGETGLPVLVLLHGSPGSGATDFVRYGRELAGYGFEVVAFDRPGFGRSSKWVESYSIEANARSVFAAMDALGIDRAHMVGWSLSGGVILRMWDQQPERVKSLVMLGAIGVQEHEGSGSYFFEHVKYGVGYGLAVVLPEALPHFGVLGSRSIRHSFIRDFWDLDQRPLRALMGRVDAPTLIVQGRHDPLVPDEAALAHHELIGPSRLVLLDASHFFPMGGGMAAPGAMELSAEIVAGFVSRHDSGEALVRRGVADYAPLSKEERESGASLGGFAIGDSTPWWVLIGIIILATFVSEDLTVVAVGLLIVTGEIDYGVGLLGCFLGIVLGDYGLWALGRFGGRRLLRAPFVKRVVSEQVLAHWGVVLERHTAKAVFVSRMLPGTRLPMYLAAGMLNKNSGRFLLWVTVAVLVWTPVLLVLTALIGPQLLGFFKEVFHGPWAYIAAFVTLVLILRVASLEATPVGRARLRAGVRRVFSHEFWPAWAFYAPLAPWLLWLWVRERGASVFTHANPGIANGGGMVNEPKTEICRHMLASGLPVLSARRIDPVERSGDRLALLHAVQSEDDRFAYPVVLKPEAGEKGAGVRVVGDDSRALAYFDEVEDAVQAQVYDAGPCEFSVLWSRETRGGAMDERGGRVVAITRKVFPELVGDGEHDIESLIWRDKRFSMQGKLLSKRFESRLEEVLERGVRLAVTGAGNHAQGCRFEDGMDLLTAELEEAVEGWSQSFRGVDGGRLDFGRYDIRASSVEAFQRGDCSIIELNGTLAEATSIYDPGRSMLWSYRLLFRQWGIVYRLGAQRRRERSGRGLSVVCVLSEFWRSRRGRGSKIAD